MLVDHVLPPTAGRPRRAVVAGSGPGGAAAALLLARAGFTVTVLERVAAPAAVGGALLLQPNGITVLQGLGIDHVPGARELRSTHVRDASGRALLDAPVAGAAGLDHNLVVRRSELFGALHALLAADDRIDVRLGHSADALIDGGVAVSTPDGPDEVDADLVVVADGVRSALRAAVSPDARVVEGPTYLRAVVAGAIPADEAGEWWTGLGLFGAAPVGDDASYVFASTAHPDVAAALADGDVARLAARWGAELPVAGDLLGRVAAVDQLMISRADEVHAPRWVTDRAALLGDAAHAMLPNSGQGANSALLDAAVLALELADAPSIEVGLDAYESRRRPAVTTVQADARSLARLAHLRSGPARRARDLALRTAARLPAERRTRRLHQEDPAAVRAALLALRSPRRA
ncbi:MAG TPA: NAD(P)/FAD-dependent oxidoreductase [Iamia sp.]|nr:NAD(P)/FAD-dependent oxidoreductase [Iamia sp.]